MSSITGLISGGGGGGIAPNQYTIDTVPFFFADATRIVSNAAGGSNNTSFWDDEAYNRNVSYAPGCFYGTKGTGWTTVYNHTGSGSFVWFLSTTFGNNRGTLAVKLTVDGEERLWQETQTVSSVDYIRMCIGSFSPWTGTNTNQTVSLNSFEGTFDDSNFRVNSNWIAIKGQMRALLNDSGALATGIPILKYETNLKIEVYNSNSTGGNAGNYYGGMVLQGY